MQIYINTRGGQVLPVQVQLTSTIGDIQAVIESKLGIVPTHQRLVFAGRLFLDASTTIEDSNMGNEATMHLIDTSEVVNDFTLLPGSGASAELKKKALEVTQLAPIKSNPVHA